MIPDKLQPEWARHVAREELLFLDKHGGGWPEALTAAGMTPAARRVMLGRLGFRAVEEYAIRLDQARPAGTDNPRVLWISLAAGVRVCLEDGFVCWGEVPGHG